MSAHTVVGMNSATATKLDAFWDSLSLEHRAALHTAFNMADKREQARNSPHFMLANAESGSRTVSNVLGSFLYFMAARVAKHDNAASMLQAIIDYEKLSLEEQEKNLHLQD